MKQIFLKGLQFIRENPRVIYSLILVVILPAAFFINTYFINSSYEKNIDKITQRKAITIENVINNLIKDRLDDRAQLQSLIEGITKENPEFHLVSIFAPEKEMGGFEVLASSNSELIGKKQNDSMQNIIAWEKGEGVAFLDRNDRGRFWNVIKILFDENGNKKALIAIAFSLEDSDALVQKTIYKSYWILIAIIITVVLLVSNQGKLFGYALAVNKLKEIDKMKDMFISMASHELRTPLTTIKGYVEFLHDNKKLQADKEGMGYLDKIFASVDRLQELVNDILEVSRVVGNRLPMEITNIDPREAITESVEEIRLQASNKGLALNYEPLTEPVFIDANKDRLKQVMINLIGNSIKYTPQGSINITMKIKNDEFLVTVADTGIGMSAEDRVHLFEKFYRIKNDKTQQIVGTGLGLWITLEIVKRMKGDISVESIEGVGSHFTVHLPISKK